MLARGSAFPRGPPGGSSAHQSSWLVRLSLLDLTGEKIKVEQLPPSARLSSWAGSAPPSPSWQRRRAAPRLRPPAARLCGFGAGEDPAARGRKVPPHPPRGRPDPRGGRKAFFSQGGSFPRPLSSSDGSTLVGRAGTGVQRRSPRGALGTSVSSKRAGFGMPPCLLSCLAPSSPPFGASSPRYLATTHPRSLFSIGKRGQPRRADNVGTARAATAGCADCVFVAPMIPCCSWGRGEGAMSRAEGVKADKGSARSPGAARGAFRALPTLACPALPQSWRLRRGPYR